MSERPESDRESTELGELAGIVTLCLLVFCAVAAWGAVIWFQIL